jgi:hypothetical protein
MAFQGPKETDFAADACITPPFLRGFDAASKNRRKINAKGAI